MNQKLDRMLTNILNDLLCINRVSNNVFIAINVFTLNILKDINIDYISKNKLSLLFGTEVLINNNLSNYSYQILKLETEKIHES